METPKILTFVLADDHGVVREGIAEFCSSRPDLSIVGQASDGLTAVELILSLRPDFAIVDLEMPKLGGLDVIRRVRMAGSSTKLLTLSLARDEDTIQDAFAAGANGYLLKEGPARHLFDAISYVLDGGRYVTPFIRREPAEDKRKKQDPLTLLSRREHEVYSLLIAGMRPKDIAAKLEISPKTVDTHRASVLRKLEMEGIADLVRFAIGRKAQPSLVGSTA